MALRLLVLAKNKLDVAVLLKKECCDDPSNHPTLDQILHLLLGAGSVFIQREALDWCKAIIAGDHSYESFTSIVRSYNSSSICGLVWNSDFVAYRCRTCAKTPCMSLCSECFLAADHEGHDFNMFKSQAGGACDCGDENVMNSNGFCSKHSKECISDVVVPPKDLLAVAEVVVPKLIMNLVYILGHQKDEKSDSSILEDAHDLVAFLQELSDMGTIMQHILCAAMCDESVYFEFKNPSSEYFCGERYRSTLASLSPEFNISAEFPELLHLDVPLFHKSLLDELFFWSIKFKFSQSIVTFILSLLPNESYKLNFVKVFVKHYKCSTYSVCQALDKSTVSNAIVHISVQLLSPMNLAVETVERHYLMQTMMVCLKFTIKPSLIREVSNIYLVDCSQGSNLKEHCYWPIVTDIVNVLSHEPIIHYFLSNCSLISAWATIVSYFQGMNLNKREKHHVLEFEPEGYYQAFSAELEICSTPLWTMLMHLNNADLKMMTLNVIHTFQNILADWLLKTEGVKRDYVSFHHPLHRYLALFISNAIQNQGLTSFDLLFSDDFLKKLLAHPLHLLACYSEINCNMWVRNGQQIKGQAMFYTHWNFASSTMDPDYFLIQVIASRLDPDEVLMSVLAEYHAMDALSFDPDDEKVLHSQSEHDIPMLESCLYFIATLINIRVLSGNIEDLIPNELISLLCVADRTHSQLTSSIPDRCGSHNLEWINAVEAALPLVSSFKPPVFEVGTVPQQGKYQPQANVWIENYNPLFVRMRTLYKKDYQASYDRYCDFVKQQNLHKGSSTLWPPFRLPKAIHPSLSGLNRIVHCSSMHALIFSLLYRALTLKTIPDSIIYLAVHLLELSIVLPMDKLRKKDKPGIEFQDKQLSTWYTSNSIFENAPIMVTQVVRCDKQTRSDNKEEKFLKKFSTLLKEENSGAKVVEFSASINESIITLLLKLFGKFSKEPYIYNRPAVEGEESRMGDGKFFIKKVLDKLCSGSDQCEKEVRRLCQVNENAAGCTSDSMQDRRLKAKLRQQRLLNDFASKQRKFMEEVISDASSVELVENNSDTRSKYVVEKVYDCCICNSSAPSTSTEPLCIAARVCPTSILSHRQSESAEDLLPYFYQMKVFNVMLANDFQKTPEVLWFKTSHLQTCGHFMHLDCYMSYISSLQQNQNQMSVLVSKGEFFCPMCRQISNAILPVIDKFFPSTQFVPNYHLSEEKQVEELLQVNFHETLENGLLDKAIDLAMNGLSKISVYKPDNHFYFCSSLLRHNLELNLLKVYSRRKCSVTTALRKSCIYPLYVVLSISSKKFCPSFLTCLWRHITTSSLTRSFERFRDIPLLLKDISDIFIQFVLGLPLNPDERHFLTLVKVLYNVNLIQLVICAVCSAPPDKITSWRGMAGGNELVVVIKNVISFISEASPGMLAKSTQVKDISVPKSSDLEPYLVERLLPYLRVASLIKGYVYDSCENEHACLPSYYCDLPMEEYKELCGYLDLKVDANNLGCVGLSEEESRRLTEKLCNDVEHLAASHPGRTRDLVKFHSFKWNVPSLIHLPDEFDTLFQFYRKEICNDCLKVPRYPSLCLVCGKLICYIENCCSRDDIPEYIWHSMECGNGTGLYIGIDSSLVLIVQSHRMAFWGSLYLDKHGEEDKNLRRGKPLYLNKERYNLLSHMWMSHSLDQLCKQWTLQGN